MDFIAGTTYQNASGQFLVLRVDASTLQVEYTSGPQAGKALTKRTAELIPGAKTHFLDGQGHNVDPAVFAPVLVEFFNS